MIKKISCAACIFLLMAGFSLPVAADPSNEFRDFGFDVEVSARTAYFLNLDSGTVIYTKNPDVRVSPASTVKIMTAALALTLCDDLDGTIVTVPDGVWNGIGTDASHADLKVGEQLTMKDLLHCILIPSANEGAVALAAFFGRQHFIEMMNQKAVELGCTNTYFDNPNGYMSNSYTTARDMAVITQWALTVPGFWEITQKDIYTMPATNKHSDPVPLFTTNEMQMKGSRYYTSYIKGVKTGTTAEAGRCLITTAQKGGTTYLLVLYGAPREETDDRIWPGGKSTYTDARLCCDWAFSNLALANVVDSSTAITSVKLRGATGRDTLLLYPDTQLFALKRVDEAAKQPRYEFIDLPNKVSAPITVGTSYGSAKVFYGDRYLGDTGLIAHEDIKQNLFVAIMDGMTDVLGSTVAMVIYAVLLLVILLYLYYMLIVVPRARKKRRAMRRKAERD